MDIMVLNQLTTILSHATARGENRKARQLKAARILGMTRRVRNEMKNDCGECLGCEGETGCWVIAHI